jgi:hypothetical protein
MLWEAPFWFKLALQRLLSLMPSTRYERAADAHLTGVAAPRGSLGPVSTSPPTEQNVAGAGLWILYAGCGG